jgi:hypothetical protein
MNKERPIMVNSRNYIYEKDLWAWAISKAYTEGYFCLAGLKKKFTMFARSPYEVKGYMCISHLFTPQLELLMFIATKVETPYHDNDLIMTPVTSLQSGL